MSNAPLHEQLSTSDPSVPGTFPPVKMHTLSNGVEIPYYGLNTGVEIPGIGLGTWQATSTELEEVPHPILIAQSYTRFCT